MSGRRIIGWRGRAAATRALDVQFGGRQHARQAAGEVLAAHIHVGRGHRTRASINLVLEYSLETSTASRQALAQFMTTRVDVKVRVRHCDEIAMGA